VGEGTQQLSGGIGNPLEWWYSVATCVAKLRGDSRSCVAEQGLRLQGPMATRPLGAGQGRLVEAASCNQERRPWYESPLKSRLLTGPQIWAEWLQRSAAHPLTLHWLALVPTRPSFPFSAAEGPQEDDGGVRRGGGHASLMLLPSNFL
jgi:hypothetical protein